jgi:hypothetical protein
MPGDVRVRAWRDDLLSEGFVVRKTSGSDDGRTFKAQSMLTSGIRCRTGTAATASPTTTPGTRPWRFTGGTITRVAVDVSGQPYIDLERKAEAMLIRE